MAALTMDLPVEESAVVSSKIFSSRVRYLWMWAAACKRSRDKHVYFRVQFSML